MRRFNKLQAIPPEIGNLIELKKLFLRFNKLTTLPDEIRNLKKLEVRLCSSSGTRTGAKVKALSSSCVSGAERTQ